MRYMTASSLIGFCLFSGCTSDPTPRRFVEGVPWIAEHRHVSDAKTQHVKGQPALRFDAALVDRLDHALKQTDPASARTEAAAVLDEAHRLAVKSTENELTRLDDAGWRQLIQRYFPVDVPVSYDVKQVLLDEYKRQSHLDAWLLQRRVEQSSDTRSLRALLLPIRRGIEGSVKDSGGSAGASIVLAPAAFAIREQIHSQEANCQVDGRFRSQVRYIPTTASSGTTSMLNWDLLERFSPVIVQEVQTTTKYDAAADQIGTVVAGDDGTVNVDTAHPVVYGYTRTVVLNERPHVQLVYAVWYPERPKLKSGIDAEAGHIDGATIRITLDTNQQPAIFETLNNCGCHHRLYATIDVEAAARRQHGDPLPDKRFALERDVKGKYDLILPKTIRFAPAARLLVRCRAGTHAVVDLDDHARFPDEPVRDQQAYVLRPYDELEQLHTPSGRVVSMFLPNGLVRGAERLEGSVFKPLGMLNAGQPRQRGTQLIQWDQFDFDDPHLLEKTLRLPSAF